MARKYRGLRFLYVAVLWFVSLFMIDTAFTFWIWHEPYSLPQTLWSSLLLAAGFALLDWFFDPFGRKKRMNG